MQQGMLSSVFLFTLFFCASFFTYGQNMELAERNNYLSLSQLHEKAGELEKYVEKDDIESLEFSIQRLAFPQQEVVRYLLLQNIEDKNVPLSSNMEQFVEKQMVTPPVYRIMTYDHDYELSVPAFDYVSIANRLSKKWQQEKNISELLKRIKGEQFNLKSWLSGSDYLVEIREKTLITVLNRLTPKEVRYLTTQVTKRSVTTWLPSSLVMVALAKKSQDKKIYRLLWLMKVDFTIEQELVRLSKRNDEFSLREVIEASDNRKLRRRAIIALAKRHPMPEFVSEFLIVQLGNEDEAQYVAQTLIEAGYGYWLNQLIEGNRAVQKRIIEQVQAQ